MPRPNPDREALERRNEARRALRPDWARPRGRPGKKVHVLSRVLVDRARCGARVGDKRWITASVYEDAHPRAIERYVCQLCQLVHEPTRMSGPAVHLKRGSTTRCGIPIGEVRWSTGPHKKLGMCTSCVSFARQ